MSKTSSHLKHLRSHFKKFWRSKLFWIVSGVGVLLILSPIFLSLVFRVEPAEKIDYGVTFSAPYAESLGLDWKETYLAILDDLQADNLRLVAYWNRIEKEEGKFDFSELDWQLTEAEKRGVSVILSVGQKVPRWPECHNPEWTTRLNEKERERAILKLLREEINHLKQYPNIKMWQVENEPYFPFGECTPPRWEFIKGEVNLVRALDPERPIIIQDSGEGGFWLPTYSLGDLLGISMYRRIWFDFWGVFLGKHIFFTYPLSHWSYPLKARFIGVPLEKIQVLELQAEPWGTGPLNQISRKDKDRTMSRDKFLETVSYAQKTGIDTFYLWGVEWWYWEKTRNNEPFFWEASKAFWR